MLGRISAFAAGRRTKWIVVAFWVVLGFALFSFQPKLQDATTNENEAFLPESAESTEVNDLVTERFENGRNVDALIAYHREGGLLAQDRAAIHRDALEIAGLAGGGGNPRAECSRSGLGAAIAVVDPFAGPVCGAADLGFETGAEEAAPTVSEDGTTALLLVRTNSETSDEIQDNVELLRELVPPAGAPEGELRAYVTGIAGIVADSIAVFESVDVTLLGVTASLVLVLLLAIYRSPVIALVPLFVVAVAYGIAAALVYGLVEAGIVEVNGQTTSLLIVLMFGAGTDYCLLIVSRYREELRRFPDRHEAMARATERTAPAILSAGGTVFAAMLVLALADFKATQTMGPVLALGILVMVCAGLTFLPALLAVFGRGAFWPSIPRLGSEQSGPLAIWRRIGHFVHDRSSLALALAAGILAVGALGNLNDRGVIDFGEGFRNEQDSVEGQLLVADRLEAGQTAVTTVLVGTPAAERAARAARSVENVVEVVPAGVSDDGALARIDITLAVDPFSDRANATIPALRDAVREAASASGEPALVGGVTAENHDTTETLRSDAKLVVPLTLAVIFLILCALLRAIVAPAYLVATVVLSYAFAIGATTLIFTELFNQPDSDPALPTFAFIFLVALGVDYNIFLISRIREEAAREETEEAVITGLERTGGVITSAGIILAGTFCALMALPLEALFQIGFTIAFGLLIDTFLVRTVLVPAVAFKLGERNWWPSRIAHGQPRPADGPPAG